MCTSRRIDDTAGPVMGETMGGTYIGPVYLPVRKVTFKSREPNAADDPGEYAGRVYRPVMEAFTHVCNAAYAIHGARAACPAGEVGLLLADVTFLLDREVRDVLSEVVSLLLGGRLRIPE